MNFYERLGVAQTATADEIKAAYRKKAKAHHSDKGGDDETMRAINAAYEILSDPEERSNYDASGCDPEYVGKSQKILATALEIFHQFIKEGTKPHLILEKMRKFIAGRMAEKEAEVPGLHRQIEQLEKYRKAITPKDPAKSPDYFVSIVDSLIDDKRGEIRRANAQIEEGKDLLKVLGEYEFTGERPSKANRERDELEEAMKRSAGLFTDAYVYQVR